MTRGGVRKGAGRPRKAEGEKRTANLCGVHVTPAKLALWKSIAASGDVRFTDWVEDMLDEAVANHKDFMKRIDKLKASKSWPKE